MPNKWYTDGLALVVISMGPIQWDWMVLHMRSSSIYIPFEHQVPTNLKDNSEHRRFCKSVKEIVPKTFAGVHSYQE